jgi:hypothetical protein
MQLLEVADAARLIGIGPSRVRNLADLKRIRVFARTPSVRISVIVISRIGAS